MMEISLLVLLLSSAFLSAFLLLTLIIFYKHKMLAAAPNLPPGSMGLPYLGESLEFLSSGWKGHPEKFVFDRISKFSSQVFKTSILAEPAAFLCGAAGNKFLFSNENKLVTAWWPASVNRIFPPTAAGASSKVESRRMRRLLPGFMKPEALQRYVGVMDLVARRHLGTHWEGQREVAVFPLAKGYTFALACRLFMSMDDGDRVARFAEPFNAVAAGIIAVPVDLPGTPFRRGVRASEAIRKELRAMVKQRKAEVAEKKEEAPPDILSHMLTTADEEGRYMTEADVVNKILGLLIGGHDTASAAITFVVKYLAELPHVYEQVYKEQMDIAKSKMEGELLTWEDLQKMKYSWNVASEVMRLAPPLQGAFREAIQDFNYGGYSIPKGWKLYWSAHSTHRNPEFFPEPEKFDPSRFEGSGPAPYTYVPFGGGPRMCPGKEYARLEILVFMHNVVKRFKWEKLLPEENIIVDPLPIPAKGLPVRLIPHAAAAK